MRRSILGIHTLLHDVEDPTRRCLYPCILDGGLYYVDQYHKEMG